MHTALVVSKDDSFREKLALFLEKYEMEIVGTFSDADEGIDRIDSLHPSAVVVDTIMPSVDGVTVLSRLREKVREDMQIYVLSTAYSRTLDEMVHEMGATLIFIESYDAAAIAKRISDFACLEQAAVREKAKKRKAREIYLLNETVKLLNATGLPNYMEGYSCLKVAIPMVIDDMTLLRSMTKRLYPQVGKILGKNAVSVERDIRNTIERAWNNAPLDHLEKIFGNTPCPSRGKPMNREFIAMIAEHINAAEREKWQP